MERRSTAFIEVLDDRDAGALRQSLVDDLGTSVDVEELDTSYNDTPDLEGFRWFRFDSL